MRTHAHKAVIVVHVGEWGSEAVKPIYVMIKCIIRTHIAYQRSSGASETGFDVMRISNDVSALVQA